MCRLCQGNGCYVLARGNSTCQDLFTSWTTFGIWCGWHTKSRTTLTDETTFVCVVVCTHRYKPSEGIQAIMIYDGKAGHGRYVIFKQWFGFLVGILMKEINSNASHVITTIYDSIKATHWICKNCPSRLFEKFTLSIGIGCWRCYAVRNLYQEEPFHLDLEESLLSLESWKLVNRWNVLDEKWHWHWEALGTTFGQGQ